MKQSFAVFLARFTAVVALSIPFGASAQAPPTQERLVSWKTLIPNLLDDQIRIYTFPVRLAHGQNLLGTGAVLGTTAGLIALDPVEGAYFRRTSSFSGFNKVFTANATSIATIVAPVALYGAGLITKDSKMQQTALFAGEAVADAELLATLLKDTTRRLRPASVPPNGNYSDTWLDNHGGAFKSGSFPSGHTIAAFSVATVVARRYRNHRWVPYAAYGLASAVALSRLSLSAHFASDVFVGSGLGYSIGRFAVLRQ